MAGTRFTVKMSELTMLAHDLRAPIARAKTYTKLILEFPAEDQTSQVREILAALQELEERISKIEADHD